MAGLEPLEVTVSDAEPVMYTVTPIQTPHQTIYIKYGDVRSSTPVRVPSDTRVEFEIVPETGYNAGALDKLSAVVDGVNITVSATPAEIKKYNLNIVFDLEAHTTLKVSKDGTVFGTYTENTVLKFQYGTVLTFALTMEEGYTETRNPNSITMNKDNTLIIQGTSKKQFTITLTQTDNQIIYAIYKGVKKTDSFIVEYGDDCTFGIETSDPIRIEVGTLSSTGFTNIKENKTITATPATIKPVDLTDFVMRKYPYPNPNPSYSISAIGNEPSDKTSLYFKTIDKLREDDYNYAENANDIIAANGAFKNARFVTKFPVIKLKENIHNISYIFAGCEKLTGDELKKNLSAWKLSGDLILTGAFTYTTSLDYIDMSVFKNSYITDLSYLFYPDNKLTTISNFDKINTEHVTKMDLTFTGCSSLTKIDVSKTNTSSVISMGYTFNGCSSLTAIDVSKWDTSNVRSMYSMFSGCSSLATIDVSKWIISKVTNMDSMFSGCGSLTTLDVSKWNTSNVTDMGSMFKDCRTLTTLDVSKWDTSNVTDINGMFSGCRSLTTLDVSKWNTSNVKDSYTFGSVFSNCSSLTTLDVSKWDTSKGRSMRGMFSRCSSLRILDVSNFKTINVTDMCSMFSNCSSLTTLDVSKWDTSNVKYMEDMFRDCTSLTNINGVLDLKSCNSVYGMFNNTPNLISVKIKNLKMTLDVFCNNANIDKSKVTVVS